MAVVLKNQPAFDCAQEHNFSFTWDGNQVFKNRLKIFRNSDNVVVYNQIQTRMQLNHILPANSLPTNGISYSAQVSVFDINGIESPLSSPILFYCYTTPVLSLNITSNQIIRNSNFNAQISYSQAQGELLKEFQIILYDVNHSQIYSTGVLYPTVTMQAVISSLVNNNKYYLKAIGITVEGTEIDTGFIPFSVSYIQPNSFRQVELTNLPRQGVIRIASHMISVTGKSNPSPPIYIGDSKVDLRVSGSEVLFDEGFSITGDFSLEYVSQDFIPYSTILELPNGTYTIKIKYMLGKFVGQSVQQAYFLLTAQNSLTEYRICSTPMTIPTGQPIYLFIQRVNNLYEIKAFDYSMTIHEWNTENMTITNWNTKNLTKDKYVSQAKNLLGG